MTGVLLEHAFTAGEFAGRRASTLALAAEVGAAGVLAFGENRSGPAVTYLTGWPVTRTAYYRLTAGDSTLWVQFHNHVASARRTAVNAAVRDIDAMTLEQLLDGHPSLATLGPVPPVVRARAMERGVELVAIDAAHARLRAVKSVEEQQALRLGAQASDAGAEALIEACRPGARDWDLLAAARDAYTRLGARDHICYLAVTDMHHPDRDVPAQFPEGRVLSPSSVVTFELSAAVSAEYPGQILRTVALGGPTEEYQRMHDVAMAARDAMRARVRAGAAARDLVDASCGIEQAGLTTTDDLFHGLGMGYLEPIGTSASRVPVHVPAGALEAGMAIVIQPNVTRRDHAAGVQTGEMVIVTQDGFEDIHRIAEGLVCR
ncbi:MAG: M24 family metallopeptidase [Candidatus Nanopelagicales bacterium]